MTTTTNLPFMISLYFVTEKKKLTLQTKSVGFIYITIYEAIRHFSQE